MGPGPLQQASEEQTAEQRQEAGEGEGEHKGEAEALAEATSTVQQQSWQSKLLSWVPKFGRKETALVKAGEGESETAIDEVVVPKDLPLDAIAAEVQVWADLQPSASCT